jgi:hypothetical protein
MGRDPENFDDAVPEISLESARNGCRVIGILNYGVEKRKRDSVLIDSKKQELRTLMERFGATKNGARIAKPLKEMVGTWGLEPQTSTVSNSSRRLTQKELITGGTGRTVILGAICYQIATKNMASGFGAESWGIGPFTSHLNNLVFASRVLTRSGLWRYQRKQQVHCQRTFHHSATGLSFSDCGESSNHVADLQLPVCRPFTHNLVFRCLRKASGC